MNTRMANEHAQQRHSTSVKKKILIAQLRFVNTDSNWVQEKRMNSISFT